MEKYNTLNKCTRQLYINPIIKYYHVSSVGKMILLLFFLSATGLAVLYKKVEALVFMHLMS